MICVRGYTYNGGTHITATPPYCCDLRKVRRQITFPYMKVHRHCTKNRAGFACGHSISLSIYHDFNIFSSHGLLPSDLVAQSVERRRSNPKVVGSIPTLVRVFLCPCVGPFPSVGLTLTRFIWGRCLNYNLGQLIFIILTLAPTLLIMLFNQIYSVVILVIQVTMNGKYQVLLHKLVVS